MVSFSILRATATPRAGQALEQRVGLLEAGQCVARLGDPGDPRRGRPLLRAHEEELGRAGLEADAARVLGVFPLGAAPKVVSVHSPATFA